MHQYYRTSSLPGANKHPAPNPCVLVVLDNCISDLVVEVIRLRLIGNKKIFLFADLFLPLIEIKPLREIIPASTKDAQIATALAAKRQRHHKAVIFITTDMDFWLDQNWQHMNQSFAIPENAKRRNLLAGFSQNNIHLIGIKKCQPNMPSVYEYMYEAYMFGLAKTFHHDYQSKKAITKKDGFLEELAEDNTGQNWLRVIFQAENDKGRYISERLYEEYSQAARSICVPAVSMMIEQIVWASIHTKRVVTCHLDATTCHTTALTDLHISTSAKVTAPKL